MKKLFFVICVLFSANLFAQKAGKGEALKPTESYSCPKHNQITSHDPGKCSICGTELSPKEQRAASGVKRYTCPAHVDVVTHDAGKCPKCGKKLTLSDKQAMKAQVMKTYTCPMHPAVSLDKDGTCPKCGKKLVEKSTH
jgi:transcription initiation factor IIE alpha subunit